MRTAAFILVVLSVVAGCATAPEDECAGATANSDNYIGEPVFDRCAGLSISMDRTSYAIGDSLLLEVAFTPLYSGVGILALSFLPLEHRSGESGVVVTESGATLSEGGGWWRIECDLIGGGRQVVPIGFVVQDQSPYHITGTVRFTEVVDPATEQSYVMSSKEQLDALGPLDHTAYGSAVQFELPPPIE